MSVYKTASDAARDAARALVALAHCCGRLTGCGKYWYRCMEEVTCGDFYEGFFLTSCKSGVGSYTYGTAKAKYIGAQHCVQHEVLKRFWLVKCM